MTRIRVIGGVTDLGRVGPLSGGVERWEWIGWGSIDAENV